MYGLMHSMLIFSFVNQALASWLGSTRRFLREVCSKEVSEPHGTLLSVKVFAVKILDFFRVISFSVYQRGFRISTNTTVVIHAGSTPLLL
jgi:hypothetical protein